MGYIRTTQLSIQDHRSTWSLVYTTFLVDSFTANLLFNLSWEPALLSAQARERNSLTWTASMYASVTTQCSRFMFFPWMASARSLVMIPSLSMTSTQASSRDVQKSFKATLSSSFALWIRPRVQAKMEATGFVEVSFPFCHSR